MGQKYPLYVELPDCILVWKFEQGRRLCNSGGGDLEKKSFFKVSADKCSFVAGGDIEWTMF